MSASTEEIVTVADHQELHDALEATIRLAKELFRKKRLSPDDQRLLAGARDWVEVLWAMFNPYPWDNDECDRCASLAILCDQITSSSCEDWMLDGKSIFLASVGHPDASSKRTRIRLIEHGLE
jgi:hypothetical protein